MGAAQTRIVYPTTPAQLTVRRLRGSKETTRCSLRKLLEKRVPALFEGFHPPWFLFAGSLQTIYSVTGDFSGIDKIQYNRTYLLLVDGGILCLDYAPTRGEELDEDAPIVVVVTAMTGGAYEPYVRAISVPSSEVGGLGYRTVVVNIRGGAGLPANSPELYNQRATNDLRQALIYLTNRYPGAPLLGLGFSIGASILIHYLAAEGAQSRLSSACALSCPWDAEMTGDITETNLIAPYTYVKDAYTKVMHFPALHIASLTREPFHEFLKTTSLVREGSILATFNQAHDPAPCTGSGETWHALLSRVRVPLLTINARDDPITRMVPVGVDSPHVVMVITPHGGHLGWFEGFTERWTTRPVLEWMRMAVEDLVVHEDKGRPVYQDEDGFLKEQGREEIGCMPIPGGLEGLLNLAGQNHLWTQN